jgi:hypothetical protein
VPKPIIIKEGSKKKKGWYFPLCSKKRKLRFSFNESFIYEGKNQTDLHKVFGIAILSFPHSFKTGKNKKWWELHKWNSLRLGARWNKVLQCAEITDYAYVAGVGERNTTDNKIMKVKLKDVVFAEISVVENGFLLDLHNENNGDFLQTFIACEMPKFYLCLRLRAYMENVFRTGDVVIDTY